jgi:hypothetical protein
MIPTIQIVRRASKRRVSVGMNARMLRTVAKALAVSVINQQVGLCESVCFRFFCT